MDFDGEERRQSPLPMGVAVLRPIPRPVSGETVTMLERLLRTAKEGKVAGLALVVLQADGRFDLHLKGSATEESNQMGVAGMLAALQKMALELHSPATVAWFATLTINGTAPPTVTTSNLRSSIAISSENDLMSLIQPLPNGPLDIIGDIHGEYDALCALLGHLGYDLDGQHPDGRTLVFVGDFCDRGPNSPAVLALAARLIRAGRAVAVLGNHEINLLRGDAKDGSGWFFDERVQRDHDKYAPFERPSDAARVDILALLSSLPIALEREDLRVVHAAWQDAQIEAARQLPMGSVRAEYDKWEQAAHRQAAETALQRRMEAELIDWEYGLEDKNRQPPFLHAHAEHEANKQMLNPLKVLTSGVERKGSTPFYSGGKWRFAERVAWWDEYKDQTPVVVGHYWRRVNKIDRKTVGKGDPDLFENTHPFNWHGQRGNVFCVDFSVGGRWTERKTGTTVGYDFKLAALSWPERNLRFEDGHFQPTRKFGV